MPSRALFCLLIALTGTLAAPAAPEAANQRFQPERTLQPRVVHPANRVVMRPSAHRAGAEVIRAKSRAFAPGRIAVLKPAAVAVGPAASIRKP